MRYVHNLSCLGGISTPDGRNILLYYNEPPELETFSDQAQSRSIIRDLADPVEQVESSQFALLLPSEVDRGDFEQQINSV